MRNVNLPTDLLRTFVTVIEVESFTLAAGTLGRTQPAISLQVQRLEQLMGHALLKREGKDISLTERGEELAAHARQILRINDLAVAQFDRPKKGSKLRLGLPVDFATDLLQGSVTKAIDAFPDQKIEIRCDLSKHLLADIRKNEMDVVVALFDGDDQQFLFRHWLEQPFWVGATDFEPKTHSELPLVVHPYGCVYRERMTTALKLSDMRWRIAFASPGIGGLQRAVRDGLGLSCLTGPTVQEGMREFSSQDGLPNLPPLHIGLFARQAQLGAAGYSIIDQLAGVLEDQSVKNASNAH